jgi:hypothetical protein
MTNTVGGAPAGVIRVARFCWVPTQYGIQDDQQKDVSSGVMRAADLRLKYEAGSSICCQPHAQARLALVRLSDHPGAEEVIDFESASDGAIHLTNFGQKGFIHFWKLQRRGRRLGRTCHSYLVVSLNSVDWRKEGVHVYLIPKGAIPR